LPSGAAASRWALAADSGTAARPAAIAIDRIEPAFTSPNPAWPTATTTTTGNASIGLGLGVLAMRMVNGVSDKNSGAGSSRACPCGCRRHRCYRHADLADDHETKSATVRIGVAADQGADHGGEQFDDGDDGGVHGQVNGVNGPARLLAASVHRL
jgi:hypothetical protein